jgi:hypothetical protein
MPDPAPDLAALRYDVERRHALQNRLDRVRQALADEHARQRQLAGRMQFERADVERLEGMTLAAFLTALRGTRDERLTKERREYVAAKLVHDDCARSVAAMEAQVRELQDQVQLLDGAEARYEAALAAREREALAASGGLSDRLRALADEIGTLQSAARELDEAAAAAADARSALADTAEMLGKASDWGDWDLFGGGLLTTAIKHDRMARARAASERARDHLQRLRTELADVGMAGGELKADVSGLATFADYLMDGFLVDWFVQGRIDQARQRVANARVDLHPVLVRLRAEADGKRHRIADLEHERRLLLQP